MIPGVRLVLLGRQGAGKGTQCARLSHHYVVPHIATGDIFRAAVKSGSALGKSAQRYLDNGELVPDEIVVEIVAERLAEEDVRARGFVLDGFPRTVVQAEELEAVLNPDKLDLVISLEVPRALVIERLSQRRVCVDCGENYSLANRPRVDWICDVCGGEVVQRSDDTEAAISRRLELYDRETAPLVAFYEERSLLAKVDGTGDPDLVTDRLISVVDERRGVPSP